MKQTIFIILGLIASFFLGFYFRTILPNQTNNKPSVEQSAAEEQPKKVTGVAGIFFKSKNPKKLKEWYKTHLGFNTDQYGATFEWQELGDPIIPGMLQWSLFNENATYFEPSTKDFMINYRVENLKNLVDQLKAENVTFVDSIETYEYGKFVHIMDIEGNKIELYEPNYAFGKTGGEENK